MPQEARRGKPRLRDLSLKTRMPLNLLLLKHGFALAWSCVIDTRSMRLAVKRINSLQIILFLSTQFILRMQLSLII